jgi:hypothetical protein
MRLTKSPDDQYQEGGNGDGTLFYAGRPTEIGGTHHIPLESLRLKLIREGHEDYEYLHHLSANGRRSAVDGLVGSLFPHAWSSTHTDAEMTVPTARWPAGWPSCTRRRPPSSPPPSHRPCRS